MMKSIFKIIVVLASLFALVACKEKVVDSRVDLSIAETVALMESQHANLSFMILDVRTDEEYSAGHLEGALNIDFNKPDFADEISKLDKSKQYLVYCRSGNRSTQAIAIMLEAGFTKIYHMKDGFSRWE